MKKITLISIILLSLILTACGTAAGSASGSSKAATLPAATKLILGTFKLERTENAVTAQQAAELIPLWQVYKSLSKSDTAAEAEVDALLQQIQETMTASQVKAINAMGLTQNDVKTVMAEQNVVQAAPQQSTTTTTSASASGPQGGPGGGMPPADMGGGDPAMGGGAAPVISSSGSTTSSTTQSAGSAGVSSALLDALIQMLQSKAA